MGANQRWALTSDAPVWLPSRLCSFLVSSLRMQALPCDESGGCSGNVGSQRSTLENVSCRDLPLNGVVAKSISNSRMPTVHQSTATECPSPLITSGAMYLRRQRWRQQRRTHSSVPTNELVRKSATQARVSMSILPCGPT